MKNNISNKDFEEALNNSDNIAIMKKASSTFINFIPKDEIERCKLIALWKTMQKWQDGKGLKFTSYLYQKVKYECIKAINDICKYNKKYDMLYCDVTDKKQENFNELIENVQNTELEDILIQRFVLNMTLKEIGKENGYSYETARKKINKAIKKIKCYMS